MRIELSETELEAVKKMRHEAALVRSGYRLCASKVQLVIDKMTAAEDSITNGEVLAALQEIVK